MGYRVTKSLKVLREQLGHHDFIWPYDQALDQRNHYGAVMHGQRLFTVAGDDVLVIGAFPHHHARHDIQKRARSIFSDVARCCEAQAAAVPHVLSTNSNCRGRFNAVVRLWVVVVNRSE